MKKGEKYLLFFGTSFLPIPESSLLRCTTSGTLASQTAVFLTSSLYHFGDTCLADRHFPHFFAVPLRGPPASSSAGRARSCWRSW